MVLTADGGDVRAYYTAALTGLRFIEGRKPTDRRFGENADARWKTFCGDLSTADRLDLLLRDADAQWSGAFGARTVFDMRAVAEDDPFGSAWTPLDAVDAEELWRGELKKPAVRTVGDALDGVCRAWGITVARHEAGAIAPADKLLLVGPGAIIAAAAVFSEGRDLDWADQVVCVATPPGHRQLGALVGGLLNASRACPVLARDDVAERAKELRLGGRRVIASNDAHADDLAAAEGLG